MRWKDTPNTSLGTNHHLILIKVSCAKTQRAQVLANALKSIVTPLSVHLQDPYYVIDGGQLLYRIKWYTGYTYDQVCDMYM